MHVSQLMTSNPHGVQAGESVRHAAQIMAKQDVGAILVYDGTELVGIVTDRDLATRALANGMPETEPVRRAMTANPVTIAPSASADEALELMVDKSIGRLPVVEGGTVKGIVTFGDLAALTQMISDGLARKQPAQT